MKQQRAISSRLALSTVAAPIVGVVLAAISTAAHSSTAHGDDAATRSFSLRPSSAVESRHRLELPDATLDYAVIADTIQLVDFKGDDEIEATAHVFYTSYRLVGRDGGEIDPATRPITYVFNGGPGSSSVWLHLGIFGPKRVDFADDFGNPGPPPFGLTDNEATLLGHTDLVFIDPVSTGYSRAARRNQREFHGVEQDIDSVAEFIRRHVTHDRRWRSPKFIAGESYGTTRAAGLADALWRNHGIGLNGVILISAVLDFSTVRFDPGNELPPALFLPTFAATAHFHGTLAPEDQALPLEEWVAMADAYALDEYLPAVMRGDADDPDRRHALAERTARFLGIDADAVLRARGRVGMPFFTKELLRDRRQTVGRLDSRFRARDRDDIGVGPEFDASYAAIRGNFTAAMNAYLREELGYTSDLPYEILTSVRPWDYGPGGNNRYLNVAERLRRAMHQQPSMQVFLASGYFDLATPHLAAENVMRRMGLADELVENVHTRRYAAGHMMYIERGERAALRDDLAAFYEHAIDPATIGDQR